MSIIIEMIAKFLFGFVFIFAVFLVVAAPLALISYPIGSYQCKSQWQGSNFDFKYSFFGGCQIKTDQAGWIPAKNYRDGM